MGMPLLRVLNPYIVKRIGFVLIGLLCIYLLPRTPSEAKSQSSRWLRKTGIHVSDGTHLQFLTEMFNSPPHQVLTEYVLGDEPMPEPQWTDDGPIPDSLPEEERWKHQQAFHIPPTPLSEKQ